MGILFKNKLVILGIIIVIIAVLAFTLFSSSREGDQPGPTGETQNKQTEEAREVLTIAGKVLEVNVNESYIVFLRDQTKEEYKVIVGDTTKLTQLVRPANTGENTSFTYRNVEASIVDVKAEMRAFVLSSQPIKAGEDIVNPSEIRLIP